MATIRSFRHVAAAAALLAACDTTVTNPGPVPDDDLNNPLAYNAIVTGARLQLARAYGSDAAFGGQIAYWSAVLAFEINPAGSTGSFGIPTLVQAGTITAQLSSGDWTAANLARFVAEDALRRFAANAARDPLLAPTPRQISEVAVWAGYANRLLGETFCGAVLPVTDPDGSLSPGDSTAHTDYFLRAEQHFTSALQTAGTVTPDSVRIRIVNSARAGRASVRLDLASWGVGGTAMWDSAAADAALVPNTFVFRLPFSDQDQNQYNYIYWARAATPYRAHTQWGTFHEGYYRTTRDARVAWDSTALLGDAAVAKFGGRVPFWPERKHNARNSPINLSSGWEMRLIEAERALVGGDPATAVNLMNQRRTNLALPTYDNTVSADSAWSLLKFERAVELWLEARRLGDLRRWIVNGVPGSYPDGLYRASIADTLHTTPLENMTTPVARSLCFPIGQNERDTNPNF
ncbi:MAG TPA: RagB/SusD family nutrient uptake outer membrane protein [Gemmatimonadales bacterium]|nr:RagB/SusD family nutrient uptake outer membrane protein [Gemmatimonadales bacterium]